jgi:hypothetical protein
MNRSVGISVNGTHSHTSQKTTTCIRASNRENLKHHALKAIYIRLKKVWENLLDSSSLE